MKKFCLALVFCAFAFTAYGISDNAIKSDILRIENIIKIKKAEIKTANLKLKIDKNDLEALNLVATNKAEIKNLQEDLKEVKKTADAQKNYLKLVDKYNKAKVKFENQEKRYLHLIEKYKN